MKGILLFTFSFLFMLTQVNAQNTVSLKMNHKLAEADFAMNQAAKNNMDQDFLITRLEYYISEISLIHDGGNETMLEDVYLLVNSSNNDAMTLGEYDITSVEKIKFYVGVDPDHNHLNPADYDASHPLSPKSPSMHWGWASGYRFVALEGKGGSDLNQNLELHGLGDGNYFSVEMDLELTAVDNDLTIGVDADYTRALENISLSSGVIVHGENQQAKICLENFRDYVFSPSAMVSSNIDFSEVNTFSTFPNPIENGMTTIELDLNNNSFNYDVSITSLDGKQLQYVQSVKDGQQLNLTNYTSGMYLINLMKDGQSIITNKVFVK